MSTEIARLEKNEALEKLTALRETIAPGLTNAEFQLFAEMCRATGLNPALKEIWAIKAGGRLQLMTGINGFLKIANSHPNFDGMEVSLEFDGKQLVSSTVKVWRKDRRFPSVATAYLAEYGKPSPIWKTMPTIMLSKCAKSLALREAFVSELGGLYTAEEMPSEYGIGSVVGGRGSRGVSSISATTVDKGSESQSKARKFDLPESVASDELPWEPSGEPSGESSGESSVQAPIAPVATPVAATPSIAVATVYAIGSLEPTAYDSAKKYLEDNCAEDLGGGRYKSPIRLKKLTSCIEASA